MNSEFGIIYIPYIFHETPNCRRGGFYIRPLQTQHLCKISVGTGHPSRIAPAIFDLHFCRVYHNNKNAIVFILLSDKNNGVRLL